MTIDWADYGIYDHSIPEDWQSVADLDDGGYEWATLHAFYSPSERRYYWSSGSGCSCNYWGEGLCSAADFHSGNKADLVRAIRSFGDEYEYAFTPGEVIDAIGAVQRHRPAQEAPDA